MKLHIKNMVCDRCIMAVGSVLKEAGYTPVYITLGRAELSEELSPVGIREIDHRLRELGFELIDDHKSQTIEKIKNMIVNFIHYGKDNQNQNYSALIESELGRDYTYISNLFSSVEGITIEKYIINQKIERVKELLVYDELTLSEIAFDMGYSSVAYLSGQFKKVTGLTPTHFKQIGADRRKPLDQV